MITIRSIIEAIYSGKIPLCMAVELNQSDAISNVWRQETDSDAMGKLLFYTTVLPVSLAVQIAETEAEWEGIDDSEYKTIIAVALNTASNYGVVSPRVFIEAFDKIEESLQRKWNRQDSENGWMTIHHAVRAIRSSRIPHHDRNTQVMINDTIMTSTYAHSPALNRMIADLLRPFGPPTLQQIVAAARAKR